MNTLSEQSIAHAFIDEKTTDSALKYARRFTEHYLEVESLDPVQREAELLSIQFPHILQPVEKNDQFAGRIRFGLVGVSPQPCGLGYYCAIRELDAWLQNPNGTSDQRATARWLIETWSPRTTQKQVRDAYPERVSYFLPSDNWTEDSGVAFPLYRMGGSILDYGKLVSLGLEGLSGEVKSMPTSPLSDALLKSIQVIQCSIRSYAEQEKDPMIRDTLLAIESNAPKTFRQALQLFWIYVLHAGTWNYGRLDVTMGPLLAQDLDSGELTEASAVELIASIWKLMHAYDNQYDNRVIIGGVGREHPEAADRFALLAIEATRRLRINQPQLSLRFHKAQNPRLWEKALDAIGEGCTFPMLYNDDVNVEAVANAFQVPMEMAEQYTPFGCGETILSHYSFGTPNGVINLTKALEVALHGGKDPVSGSQILDLPQANELQNFEDLWSNYSQVVEQYIQALAQQQRLEYAVMANEAPCLLFTLLSSDCLQNNRSIFDGGIRYLGGTLETYGNINAADSLFAIRELVFERQEISLTDLVSCLDQNFESENGESIRERLKNVSKYGNDEAFVDQLAQRVHNHVCNYTRDQASEVGLANYLVVIINNWANTLLGWKTAASADGRRFGEPLANANNPSPGSDLSGPTAFLNSLVKLDPGIHAGAVQNMKFSKQWFSKALKPKFDALLKTYFANGGTQAMITVVSKDDLEAAMKEPGKWGHLMVRVGGFSIRFVELPKEAQLEVIGRTLH